MAGGFELNAIYVSGALALAFGGFGEYSLDRSLALERFYSPTTTWIAIAIAVIIAALNLAVKRPVAVAEKSADE